MAKGNSGIGHAECPYCGKRVSVIRTERYWYHVPAQGSEHATKGQFRIYCTGSGELISEEQRRQIRSKD